MSDSWKYTPEETEEELADRLHFEYCKREYDRIINILQDAPLAALSVKDLNYIQEKPWRIGGTFAPERYFYTQTRLDTLLIILKKVEGD